MKFKILTADIAICHNCNFLALYMKVQRFEPEERGFMHICLKECEENTDHTVLVRMILALAGVSILSNLPGTTVDLKDLCQKVTIVNKDDKPENTVH